MTSAGVNTTSLPPPPPSPPPPFSSGIGCEDASACAYFDVSDREIVTSLGIFACMGAFLLVIFGAIRHKAPIFFGRRRLRNLTHRPPPIPRPDGTWSDAVFGWMTHVLRVPDKELVATAGIDALAFIRVCQFGIQLFFPITIVSLCVFLPTHVSGTGLDQEKAAFVELGGELGALRSGLNSRLMRTTAANLTNGDPVMWLHVVATWSIVVYGTWLLRRHTRTFALLRQLYLTTAGDTNLWRAVHMPTTILQQMLVQGREVQVEMDVGAMRAQVTESNALRQSGSPRRDHQDDERDDDDDNVSRGDVSGDEIGDPGVRRDKTEHKATSSPTKQFHEDLHMNYGLGVSSSKHGNAHDDGFEFDVVGVSTSGSAGKSRFHPRNSYTPLPPQNDESVVVLVPPSSEERKGHAKRNKPRSPTARASLNAGGSNPSTFHPGFQDDMADTVFASAGKHGARKGSANTHGLMRLTNRGEHREPRVGGMSIEAMAFLATPMFNNGNKHVVYDSNSVGIANAGGVKKQTGLPGVLDDGRGSGKGVGATSGPTLLPTRERVPTVFEATDEGADGGGPLDSVSPRINSSPAGDRDERDGLFAARRSRGGMKELKNNIKGLRKQQAAKAKAAASSASLGGCFGEKIESLIGASAATHTAQMAGLANAGYETPGLARGNSGVNLRQVSVFELTEHRADRRVQPDGSPFVSTAPTPAQARTPEISSSQEPVPETSASPSPPKLTPSKKKLKVPKGMRIGLQAAKAKRDGAKRDAVGDGEAAVGLTKTVGKTVGEPTGPGPVVESYDDQSFGGTGGERARGGSVGGNSGAPLARSSEPPLIGSIVAPASAGGPGVVTYTRPPTVYSDRDGVPTVYFGPDGGEGSKAAAASAAVRRGAFGDTGYLERVRQNITGAVPIVSAGISGSAPSSGQTTPSYTSPPRGGTRGSQPRAAARPDNAGPHAGGVPLLHLDTRLHVIAPAEVPIPVVSTNANDKTKDAKKKSKHKRNNSLPTKEYLATLGFGGVGLDEAFDLGGNRTKQLKAAELREAERERLRRDAAAVFGDSGGSSALAGPGGVSEKPISKNATGLRLDRILSNTGHKTPGGGGRHVRHMSSGAVLGRSSSAHDLGDPFSFSRGDGTAAGAVNGLHNRSGVVTTLHDRVVHHASKLTAADLGKGNTLFPIDDIAHGAVSPLLASDVKRVLEHVADAHRNRHRRRESAESGSVGSSPSHSRNNSWRDLSGVEITGGNTSGGTNSNEANEGHGLDGGVPGGDLQNVNTREPFPRKKKPSVEDADFFDGWVDVPDGNVPDVAIDHDWWSGLNIDDESEDEDFDGIDKRHAKDRFESYYVHPSNEDYEGSRHGAADSTRTSKAPDDSTDSWKAPTANQMDLMERGDLNPNSPDATASAAKGAARAARMVEMPVPDVNARRTVNTYDPDSQRLVSVWAANYTVLMTDLVPVRQGDGSEKFPTEAVEAMFANLFPDEFRGIIPVFDHRPVDRLLDQRDELLNILNKLTEKQRRSYQTTYTKRDWRVMTSVDAARDDLRRCEQAVVLAREAVLAGDPGPSCFAVFATQKAAAEAAQCLLHSGSRRNFRVQPAPGPDNVNWQTLLYRREQSLRRIVLITPLVLFILLFPSGIFTVGVASACVGESPGSLEWYCSAEAAWFKILISGLLPPVLLTLWEVFVVSFFLMYCVQAQNVHASCSSTDRRFLRYYFVWGFVNVLLGGITGGALTSFAQQALGQDNTTYSIQKHLGRVLPISSNFFLVFVFFRSVYLPIQRLILPHPGIICWAVRRYLCVFGCAVTKRDRTVKYSPRGIRMGREVGVFLMVAMLGLTFCLTAPMIAPACLLFFVANFVVWRYHTLYVYERGWESNGSMWFTVVELVVWSLLVAQSFTSCVLFSKQAYLEGIVLYITVPYYLYKYIVSVKAEFGSGNSWSVPLGEAAKAPPADFSAEIYTHPSLRPAAMGWHPDVGKVWRGYPGVAVKHTL